MPSINPQNTEQSLDAFAQTMQNALQDVSSLGMSYPIFIAGVNRKLNTGNFENLDIFGGLTVPIPMLPTNIEAFQTTVQQAAELGFSIASQETGSRYEYLKQLQKGERRQ